MHMWSRLELGKPWSSDDVSELFTPPPFRDNDLWTSEAGKRIADMSVFCIKGVQWLLQRVCKCMHSAQRSRWKCKVLLPLPCGERFPAAGVRSLVQFLDGIRMFTLSGSQNQTLMPVTSTDIWNRLSLVMLLLRTVPKSPSLFPPHTLPHRWLRMPNEFNALLRLVREN